ncbi:MAG: hypothetical protein H6700_12935 [Myxococcales bacterium]|nr:hypothetical protein [Myxococcales bacterium]
MAPRIASTTLRTALAAVALCAVAAPASAASNDITIRRFGTCAPAGACETVDLRTDDFSKLTRDLGLMFGPTLNSGAETLGPAGFAIQFDQNIAVVDANEDYWTDANVDRDASGTMLLSQLHLRKGLPLSLELGGFFTILWQSQLLAVGSEIRWALHEDTLWPVPDLSVRGYVSTVLGSSELNVTTAGAEIVTGLPIGVGNVANITPYVGYNLAVVISASRLIDATPLDPRPPITGTETSQPEFVFPVETQLVHQGVVGLRTQFAVTNVGFQAQFSPAVQNYTLSLGFEF